MADQEKILDHLSEVFHAFESGLNGKAQSTLHHFQKESFASLKQYQFPDRKHEDWKYTIVQNIIAPPYTLADVNPRVEIEDIPGLDTYKLVVSNGQLLWDHIDPALKDAGIRLMRFDNMLDDESMRKDFNRVIKAERPSSNQAFAYLNFAFQSGAFAIDIPSGFILDKPIEIRIVHDGTDTTFSHPLYFIRAQKSSEVTIIERFEKNNSALSADHQGLINASAYLSVDKNASVTHYRWQNLPATYRLVNILAAQQERDSRFTSYAFDIGGQSVRNNIHVELEDSNTYSSLQAAYMAKNKQSIDHQTRINHKVPHCESHELYKGIIDDQASGAFNGKVLVHPDAQKTNAFQQNDSLVLSPHARMNSKPQLEIFADDVKCSHGATIGQLDQKSLFYLMSRGLQKEAAKHMLTAAFLAEVLDTVTIEPLSEYIRTKMSIDV